MDWPLSVVVSPFRSTSRMEGRGPHHHVEAARRWCSCNNLSPRSNPCAVFNLGTVTDKKNSSRDPEFPNSQSPKDTANTYASDLRSYFSQQTPRLSRGAERSFMHDLRSDQCSDSSLHNTFCSPFTTKELTTAISKLNFHCLRP